MKISFKILMINLFISVAIASCSLIVEGGHSGDDVAIAFGLVCLGLGLLNLLVGVILLIVGKTDWGGGMMLSFAVLLLLSGISCSQGLRGL